jgi:type IV pilus assembly protein PilO
MAVDFKDLTKLKWYFQVLIVAVVCASLLGGLWYGVLASIQADIQTESMKLDELQKTIAKSLIQQKELAQIKAEALKLQAQLEMLKMILPQEKETDQLLRTVQQQAMMSGLEVRRVSPRPTIDHEVYTEWPIDLEVLGTYHNVGLFLDRIRQLPRIVNITGLNLQGRASEGDAAFTASVGATYTATTFVYKDEPIASTAPPANSVK